MEYAQLLRKTQRKTKARALEIRPEPCRGRPADFEASPTLIVINVQGLPGIRVKGHNVELLRFFVQQR
jgi:hypothetical protein